MDVMATHVVTTIRLDARENGPIGTANGGFACGTFAGLVGGTAEVRLEVPVPLGVDLEARIDGTGARVRFAGQTLAAPRATDPFVLTPPARPGLDQAMRARLRHPFHGITHPLSGLPGCGPERTDGLGVTPGPLDGDDDILAAPFVPTDAFAVDGRVRAAAVWGALTDQEVACDRMMGTAARALS